MGLWLNFMREMRLRVNARARRFRISFCVKSVSWAAFPTLPQPLSPHRVRGELNSHILFFRFDQGLTGVAYFVLRIAHL